MGACAIASNHLGSGGDGIRALHIGALRSLSLLLLVVLMWVLGGRRTIDDRAASHAGVPFLIQPGLATRDLEIIGRDRRHDVGIGQGIGEGLIFDSHILSGIGEVAGGEGSLICSSSSSCEAGSVEGGLIETGIVCRRGWKLGLGRRHDASTKRPASEIGIGSSARGSDRRVQAPG